MAISRADWGAMNLDFTDNSEGRYDSVTNSDGQAPQSELHPGESLRSVLDTIISAAEVLVESLDINYGISSVKGHSDAIGGGTECPGSLLEPFIPQLKQYSGTESYRRTVCLA